MIIIDFDYTLYKTDLLVRDMKAVLHGYGVSKENFDRSYKEALHWDGDGYGFDYSFEKQVEILQASGFEVDLDEAVTKLKACIKKEYLFSDTPSFLQFLESLGGEVVILTAGDAKFQKMKVEKTGVCELVDRCVYLPGNKESFVAEALARGGRVVFINDNSKENAIIKKKFPRVKVIGKINSFRYAPDEVAGSGIPYFATLTEIKDYIVQQKNLIPKT